MASSVSATLSVRDCCTRSACSLRSWLVLDRVLPITPLNRMLASLSCSAILMLLSVNVCQSPGRLSVTLYRALPDLRWIFPRLFFKFTLLESAKSLLKDTKQNIALYQGAEMSTCHSSPSPACAWPPCRPPAGPWSAAGCPAV